MQITDTAALVTGGASGLGAATATALAEAGATVFALDLAGSIEKAGEAPAGIEYVEADVTDPASVSAAVARAVGSGKPLRTVVNCAGIGTAGRILGKGGHHDLDLYARIIQINLIGSFNVLALAAEEIARTEPDADGQRGRGVNTASDAPFEGQIGQVAYASSKGGIVGMNLPAARDLAQYGIRVNTIAPGIIETPMLAGVEQKFRDALAEGVPFPKRLGRPEEYARLVLALVEHDYINGEVIRLDGALRMAPR
jgi:NAD(P)-dependent dehydrogenase (short-subunit alcohol dehydrogenase family)